VNLVGEASYTKGGGGAAPAPRVVSAGRAPVFPTGLKGTSLQEKAIRWRKGGGGGGNTEEAEYEKSILQMRGQGLGPVRGR